MLILYIHKIQQEEPTYSTYQFNNKANTQTVAFIINMTDSKDAENVSFDKPSVAINQQDTLLLLFSLKRNDILYCDGKTVKLYKK